MNTKGSQTHRIDGFEVVPDEIRQIDDDRRGVRPAFVYLVGLLLVVVLIVAAVSVIAALSDFGA